MSKSIFTSEQRHLVAKGNYKMVEGGKPLFNCPSCAAGQSRTGGKREKLFFNCGVPGQIVAYSPDANPNGNIPWTIDITNLAALPADAKIYLGVLVDQDNDGVADDVRLIAGEYLTKCNLDEINVGKPCCGNPAIEAASLDCVKCNETYVAKVTVDSNKTRSFGLLNNSACSFVGTYYTDCCTCDGCPPEQNCKEIACGIVDSLNNSYNLEIDGRMYPDLKQIGGYERPYRAVVGHKHWYTFCIPSGRLCDCDSCSLILDDAGAPVIVAGAAGTGLDVTFEGNTTPVVLPDGTVSEGTAIAMLDNIATQLECAFENQIGHNSGFAIVTHSINNCCCGARLTVVTCVPDLVIEGLEPCPFEFPDMEFMPYGQCVCTDDDGNCVTEEGEPYIPDCWIAVIASPDVPDCDCLPKVPATWSGIKVTLDFLTNPGDCKPIVKRKTLLEPTAPRNFGAQIQFLETKYGFPSGRGRNYSVGNYRRGKTYGDYESRAKVKNAVTADCDAMYCSYYLDYSNTKKGNRDRNLKCFPFYSGIHIDKLDVIAQTCFEEFIEALAAENTTGCKIVEGVSCGPQEDVDKEFDKSKPKEEEGDK